LTIDVPTYGLYIGIIAVAAAIVVPIIVYYLQNKKKKLVFEEIQNLSVINVKKDFKDKIEIKYADKIVDNLFVSTARFKNKGTLPIKEKDIIKPIEIIFDKKILKADVIEVSPKGIDVELDTISEGKSVHCKFNLLNPNDYFTLQFVSLEKLSTPEINPRIEGLSKIDIVGSNVVPPYYTTPDFIIRGFLSSMLLFSIIYITQHYFFSGGLFVYFNKLLIVVMPVSLMIILYITFKKN